MKALAKLILDWVMVAPARKLTPARKVLLYATEQVFGKMEDPYQELKEQFILAGRNSRYGEQVREEIALRFENVDQSIDLASNPADGLFLANAALANDGNGALVECGCWNGGMSAKLSIVAELTARELVVFDSFAGLPDEADGGANDINLRMDEEHEIDWQAGQYAAGLDEVRENITRHGEISSCRFVRGYFEETMQLAEHLPSSVDLAFVDVDLASSMRDCLLGLWPRLVHGATFFTHDAPFLKVLQALNDQETWASLGDHPPVIFGAGYGFGDASPYLGLLVKGQVDGTYMRHVTLANRPRPSISWVDMRRS